MDAMTKRRASTAILRALALVGLAATAAGAQDAGSQPPAFHSGPWIVAGTASTSTLANCSGCTGSRYLHTGSIMGIVGRSFTPRLDAGFETLFVTAASETTNSIRTTYVLGTVHFRPWRSRGLFVGFSSGMGFVRNWVVDLQQQEHQFTSQAFALAMSTGWEWRVSDHFGLQAFGAQHVATLGDLTTDSQQVENIVGNFWSVGAAVVIR